MDNKPTYTHNPRTIARCLYDGAKQYLAASLVLKCLAAIVGISVIVKGLSAPNPWLMVVLALIAEGFQLRSDYCKSRAESLQRKIELDQGLGWPISGAELSDYLVKLMPKKRRQIEATAKENYFASDREAGARHLLENLQESAWWSKELAGNMTGVIGVLVLLLLAGSIGTFATTFEKAESFTLLENVNRLTSSIVAIAITLGLLKQFVGYFSFSRKSEQIEKATLPLLAISTEPSEMDAIKLLHDYQIARAGAPLVPNILWRIRRNSLNELWDSYRKNP